MVERPAPQEYETRLGLRQAEVARLDRWDRRLGNARVAAFGLALLAAWPTLMSESLGLGWLAAPLVLFTALVVAHGPVVSALTRRRCGSAYYRDGLARLAWQWGERPDDGARFRDDEHPYATDLDLFGPRSLYQLLSTARSLPGREALAGWLSRPASPNEIAARQEAIAELRGRLDLQEDVVVLAADLSPEIEAAQLDEWGRAPRRLPGLTLPIVGGLLGAVNLATAAAWLAGPLGGRAVLPILAVSGILALLFRARVRGVLADLSVPAGELRFLGSVLRRLETESFASRRLRALQRRAGDPAKRPSSRLGELARLIEWNDSRGNLFFQPLAALLLLGTQLACAAERWRERNGEAVGDWLRAIGEFEALSALATFWYENPDYVLPEVVEGPASLDGEALAHPLLPRRSRVANAVRLGGGEADGEPHMLLVSGSNMSGKSTLLRTVGVAAVLAQAGAPVPAARLRLSPLAVGASIRLHDSLVEGVSRFLAELQRLSQIRDLATAGPTLFLLDEILHGTNSHDRRLGAAGVLRGLLGAGAIGLVTTHDLALAEIVEELAPAAVNMHFEDHLEEGRMAFDYVLRPGVVVRGNALALMRSLGLPVAGE